eukprot:Hpha_TRINITY_DN16654_c0_g8::TRINITY_DN16654_c0_g8_i1::g.183226::m.183226
MQTDERGAAARPSAPRKPALGPDTGMAVVKAAPPGQVLNTTATAAMCHYCFHILESALQGRQPQPTPSTIPNFEAAIFVSYTKGVGTASEELRGCKGTHAVRPLHEQLRRFALCSAFEDTRFQRIHAAELPNLSCTVSVLGTFEKIKDPYDWDVGVHGIKIEFPCPQTRAMHYGTFLPHVAPQMRWSREQTLVNLVAKAGYTSRPTGELFRGMHIERFTDSQHCTPFHDYTAHHHARRSSHNQHHHVPHGHVAHHHHHAGGRRESGERVGGQSHVGRTSSGGARSQQWHGHAPVGGRPS